MNIEFLWTPLPSSKDQEVLEGEISGILRDRDIKPCHSGAISVLLGISGPLDNKLQGSAKCQCGKILIKFEGGSRASNLLITEFD